jgi:hypothetical protein
MQAILQKGSVWLLEGLSAGAEITFPHDFRMETTAGNWHFE